MIDEATNQRIARFLASVDPEEVARSVDPWALGCDQNRIGTTRRERASEPITCTPSSGRVGQAKACTEAKSMQLLTIAQVQQRLAVSRTTVYRLIRSGDLPTVKIRENRRIREQDLDAFIEANLGIHLLGEDEA